MARSQLRLYRAPEQTVPANRLNRDGERLTLPLSEIFPLLLDAVRGQRTWLRDFDEDEITISGDLYDVLRAYQHFRPSA